MKITAITPDEEFDYMDRSDFMPVCRYGPKLSAEIVTGEIGALVKNIRDVLDPITGIWEQTVHIKERLVIPIVSIPVIVKQGNSMGKTNLLDVE